MPVTVTVYERRAAAGAWGDEAEFSDGRAVPGCLVAPASSDLPDRPNAVEHDYTVHFPRGFGHGIDGARVLVPDGFGGSELCEVVGAPRPLDESVCRGPWSMRVDVKRVSG